MESVRRALDPWLTGARIVDAELRRPDLRLPFPPRFRARLVGHTVRALRRRAKYLLAELSSGETLVVHLGMSGSFRIDPPPPAAGATGDKHDHVVLHMESGATITFNDPRRFGQMVLADPVQLHLHPAVGRLGPEPLSDAFDAAALARACWKKRAALKVALLDQRVVAGLGNIYASEALHGARLSPFRRASTIATASGAPRRSAHALARAIKTVLAAAIDRAAMADYRGRRFRVYDREGERCLRRGCGGVVKRRSQAGRSTFYCPVCQR